MPLAIHPRRAAELHSREKRQLLLCLRLGALTIHRRVSSAYSAAHDHPGRPSVPKQRLTRSQVVGAGAGPLPAAANARPPCSRARRTNPRCRSMSDLLRLPKFGGYSAASSSSSASPGAASTDGRVDLGAAEQLVHAATARLRDERHDGALLARAAGAAGAVQVGLVLVGRVGLDDQGDVVDVDAAGRDIRRHQHVDAAAGEQLRGCACGATG